MGLSYDSFKRHNMKLIIIAALVAFAAAAPRPQEVEVALDAEEEVKPVAIIRQESEPIEGNNFRSEFEAENEIYSSLVGSADESGASVMSGSYSFPLPDGSIATFNWVADALGFRVESPLLPVAPVAVAPIHPIPAHAQEQIDYAKAQQEAGFVWDQSVNAWVQ